MRIGTTGLRLRLWHLLGLVAAGACFLAVMQFRWETEDEGYLQLRRLRSPDAAERMKAASRLGWLRPRERRAIGPLTEALFDAEARVRAPAAWSLMDILRGDKADPEAARVMAALGSCLGDRDPRARAAIANALAIFRPEPGVIVPTLLELARDGDVHIRAQAVGNLGMFARGSEPALAALFAALGDAHPAVRGHAINGLDYYSNFPGLAPDPLLRTVVAALVGAADDEAPDVRVNAVRTLGQIAGRSMAEIPRVVEALGDPDAEVRLAAATNLAWRRHGPRSPALIPALARSLTDADARVRRASAHTLGRLGLDGEAALPALRESAGDADPDVRREVAEAAAAIEKTARDFRSVTLPGDIADLGDANSDVRALAADRLAEHGPRAAEAVPTLARCLADREPAVRRAAAVALGRVGPSAAVAIPALAERAESDDDERVRRAASLARSALLRGAAGGAAAP